MASDTAAPGLSLRGTQAKWEMHLDVKAVAAAIGDDVLAHFYRCFVAVDRIVALESLLVLNATKLDRDSVASARNMHHLALLLAAAMYEVGAALQSLTSGPYGRTLQSLAAWAPLNQLRAEWNQDAFASRIRNGLAHHFGEIDRYRTGIDQGPASAVMETGEGSRLHDSRMVEPWNALFRGEGLEEVQMHAFVKNSRDAHMKLPELVMSLFHEVLITAGIMIRNEMT